MKSLITSFKLLAILTILTGIIYPMIIWTYSNIFVQDKSNGSFLKKENITIGSELIGQKFTRPNYFWPRPSAIDYNPTSSGASNLGPTSLDLKKQVDERLMSLTKIHSTEPPQDLIFASASGLDPHISLASAEYQLERVAQSRSLSVTTLRHLVQELTEKPQYGIFGETRINVLKLNLAVENLHP